MLHYLQRDGIHSLRVSRILTVEYESEGLTQTSVYKLCVDTTRHVYNAWATYFVLKVGTLVVQECCLLSIFTPFLGSWV